MTLASEHTAWRPGRGAHATVCEDRCAADPSAPPKNWVYAAPAIGFVVDGWFDYVSQGRTVLSAPGSVVLGNAGDEFYVRHLDALGNRRLVVEIGADVLDDAANGAHLDAPRFQAVSIAPGPHATRMLAWMRAIAAGGAAAEECELLLAQTALAAPAWDRDTPRVTPRDRLRVEEAARYIDAHYAKPCTLQSLARLTQLNRFHLVRAFGAVLGQSPNQYVINTRVRAAAERLRTSNDPITEIALEVGFNDISHFYSCFRAAFGVTPRQWRLRERH